MSGCSKCAKAREVIRKVSPRVADRLAILDNALQARKRTNEERERKAREQGK